MFVTLSSRHGAISRWIGPKNDIAPLSDDDTTVRCMIESGRAPHDQGPSK